MLDGKKILIVEDQYLIAADLSQAIAKLGGTIVGPVADTEAARAHLANSAVDLAFLDINLGDGTVFPLADELESHGIPFVFATGHDSVMVPDRFKSKFLLEKPFTLESLREIARLLAAEG